MDRDKLLEKYGGSYVDRNEAVRNREENCESCGDALVMYYAPWCPRCDKPEPVPKKVLNFLQCVRHIEVVEGLEIGTLRGDSVFKNALWRSIEEYVRNDIYIDGGMLSLEEIDDRWDPDGDIVPALKLFNKHFPVDDDTLFWISW